MARALGCGFLLWLGTVFLMSGHELHDRWAILVASPAMFAAAAALLLPRKS